MGNNENKAPLLAIEGVDYYYGRQKALEAITAEVRAGELVALVGRNGAGKSTLLRCVAGWTRVDEGDIRVLGLSIRHKEREARRQLVFVPDNPPFYEELTAWEHIQFVAQVNGLSNWQGRAEKLLRRFGLWGSQGQGSRHTSSERTNPQDTSPLTFSRGMRYKLALVIALTAAPKLLLLDEPFGPLDPLSANHLWKQLEELRDEGMSILLSSHQLPPEAEPDRYLIMEQGRVIAAGNAAELASTLGLVDKGSRSLAALLGVSVANWESVQQGG